MSDPRANQKPSKLKVAIVCDWLTGIGGAERVVLELHRLFPKAPIYTSQYNPKKIDWFKNADVRTGWLQYFPVALKKFFPVLRAISFSRLNLNKYDLVISSSGAEAKAIKTGPKTLHISYCHAPTHYYWSRYNEYMKHPGWGFFNPLAKIGLKLLVGPMRRWDYKAAQRPDVLIANSTYTGSQIKEYYGRESTVIHPPVDIQRFQGPEPIQRKGFVIAGRQTPYKRVDLAVAACTQLEAHLAVVGTGPDHEKLRKMAGATITFLTNVSDENMRDDLKAAHGFIFPNVDDFGIIAVEAMAAGTPVIAYQGGGALDYVIEGKTGTFFNDQTVDSLAEALKNFRPEKFDRKAIAQHAKQFSTEIFRSKMAKFIVSQLKQRRETM